MKLASMIAFYIINVFIVFLFYAMYLDAKQDLHEARLIIFDPGVIEYDPIIPPDLVYLDRPEPKPESIQTTCLAQNIYHEARGEDRKGMVKVGFVTLNRVESSRWPDTICGTVYQPAQFSWTFDNPKIKEKESYQEIKELAAKILDGEIEDNSRGSTHYFAHVKIDPPYWADSYQVVSVTGNHTFLK